MQVISMKCPECGGTLNDVQVAEGKTEIYCQFCGHKILLQPEQKTVVVRNEDVARLKELELEQQKISSLEKEKEQKLQKGWLLLKLGGILLAIGAVLYAICGAFNWEGGVTFFSVVIFAGIIILIMGWKLVSGNKKKSKKS